MIYICLPDKNQSMLHKPSPQQNLFVAIAISPAPDGLDWPPRKQVVCCITYFVVGDWHRYNLASESGRRISERWHRHTTAKSIHLLTFTFEYRTQVWYRRSAILLTMCSNQLPSNWWFCEIFVFYPVWNVEIVYDFQSIWLKLTNYRRHLERVAS